MSNTKIFTKSEFIEMLSASIKDDQVVLFTQNVNTVEVKPKYNEKRVTFGLAADAFYNKDGVNDLMRLKGYLLGVVICGKQLLSEGAKKIITNKPPTNE